MRISVLITLCTTLIISCNTSKQTPSKAIACSDLAVVQINEPDYDYVDRKAYVTVEVVNNGKLTSDSTEIVLRDWDFSYNEAVAEKLHKDMLDYLKNDLPYYVEQGYVKNLKEAADYVDKDDDNAEFKMIIPPIKPKNSELITFDLGKYWPYNPNCELEVVIDEQNLQEDCDRANNIKHIMLWG